jgi:hypothetical protein
MESRGRKRKKTKTEVKRHKNKEGTKGKENMMNIKRE